MLRISLVSAIAAGLFIPSFAHAEIMDDLLNINDILGSLCGQRMVVLWVDETEQIPPCLMAYSNGCIEAQNIGPQSCTQSLEKIATEPEHLQVVSSVSVQ